MLGDGMVSFGVAVGAPDFRKVKSSAKMHLLELQLAGDAQRGGREFDVALLVVKLAPVRLSCALVDAADLVEEIHVPGAAAELAVGNPLQADLLLHLDDVAD